LHERDAHGEDMTTRIRKQLLLTVLAPEEIEKLHVDEKTDEEVIWLLRQRLLEVTFNQGLKQKVVPSSEVEGWLAKGWTWKGNLGDGRVSLRVSERRSMTLIKDSFLPSRQTHVIATHYLSQPKVLPHSCTPPR
jgi:hypothetical protein